MIQTAVSVSRLFYRKGFLAKIFPSKILKLQYFSKILWANYKKRSHRIYDHSHRIIKIIKMKTNENT